MSASSIWPGNTWVSLTSFRHRPMPRRPPSPPTAPECTNRRPAAARPGQSRDPCHRTAAGKLAEHIDRCKPRPLLRAQAEDDGPVRDTGSGRTQVEHDHLYDHACNRITERCQYPQAAKTIVSASNNERRGPSRSVKPPTQAEQILCILLGRQEEAAGKGSRRRCPDTWRLDDRLGRQAAGEGKGNRISITDIGFGGCGVAQLCPRCPCDPHRLRWHMRGVFSLGPLCAHGGRSADRRCSSKADVPFARSS
jgi:hypothetical protein